ncbi:MAG: diacylglycerol kinase family protein [Deltaproteobacteria bacterium]|nr:diacylglycerol kinase family protein [Deltaproteobacteria bacterium]
MHNPSAGSEEHSARDLVRAIERAGHTVIEHVTDGESLSRALRSPCQLVAIAGGDGTVGRAAEALAGTGVPFTVLALGTANNVARTLRLDGPVEARIAAWATDTVHEVDAATARQGGVDRLFFEAIGFGVFPELVLEADGTPAPDDPEEKLVRDLALFREQVARLPLARYEVDADGDDLSGDYLMVEVMNIPLLGPRVSLASAASPSDGLLDLVLVGEAQREGLLRALDRRRDGDDGRIELPGRKVARVVIAGDWQWQHHDGDLRNDRTSPLEAKVNPAALRALAPRPAT